MRSVRGQRHCCAQVVMLLVLGGMGLRAQQPESSPPPPSPQQTMPDTNAAAPLPDDKSYVLHVYQNLMQIPTVVVMPRMHLFGTGRTLRYDAVTGLAASNFQISLDRGTAFRPTHMRVQGEDPISLAIVVDLSSHPSFLLPTLGMELQHMVETSLLPHDHVSLYAANCRLLRWRADAPADSPTLTKEVFAEVAGQATDKRAGQTAGRHKDDGCSGRSLLFDDVATVVRDLSALPGRRIIVVVSRGDSRESTIKWPMVKRYAAGHSTAIFGVTPLPELGSQNYDLAFGPEDPFNALCQLTGGLVFATANSELRETLASIVDIVRKRYILEFPRPNDGVAGEHDIDVTVPKSMAMIRPAGVSVPLADPSILNDPTTVPSAPSPATFGTRKPLKNP